MLAKCKMMFQSLMALVLIYTVLVLGSAVLFSYEEGVGFFDSLWWATTTATTTGYGDITPKTTWGRWTGMFLMNFGTYLVSPLLTAHMAATLIVNNDAFTHAEQEEIKTTLKALKERLESTSAST